MRRKRALGALGLVLATAAAACLAGCGGGGTSTGSATSAGSSSSTSGGAPSASAAVKVAVLVLALEDGGYSRAVADGAAAAAAKAGNASSTTFDGQFEPQKQLADCQDALASGEYQAMVIFAVDATSIEACVHRAEEAGVPVAATEVPIGADYASTEPTVPGVVGQVFTPLQVDVDAAVAMTNAACDGAAPCEVGYLIGESAAYYSAQREKAVLSSNSKKFTVAQTIESGFSESGGLAAAKEMLQAHPEINVIIADNDAAAAGAAKALATLDMTGKVAIIGDGGSKISVSAIKDGTFAGDVPYAPRSSGEAATTMAIESARGGSIGHTGIDGSTLTGVGAELGKANIDRFEPQW